jgi:hypothetical protein
MNALKGGLKMKVIRSGIEVTPEELKKLGIGNRVSHCCPDIPTGCRGQTGHCIDRHTPGLEVRDTMPNHLDSNSK